MKKLISVLLAITLLTGLCTFAGAEDVTIVDAAEKTSFETALQLIDIYAITDNTMTETLKKALLKLAEEDEDAFYKMMNAIAQTVDEHSCYYSEEEWEALSKDLSGVICGIGVTAMVINGCFEVVTTIEGGSAKEAGIVPGDKIVEADGVDITGAKANFATNYITGEEGTKVTIKVIKKSGDTVEYTLDRRVVVVPSVEKEIIEDGNIGYLVISNFTSETGYEIEKALTEFKNAGVTNLIIDVRNNGGGIMDAGMYAASLLLDKDEVIISTHDNREKTEPKYYRASSDGFDFNTVILLNEYTASASEIMSSAILENGHAVSVGKKTYGKASAQSIWPLSSGGALRITTLHYQTAKGNFINKVGIEPDFDVDNTTFRYTLEEAPKLTYENKFTVGDEHDEIEGIETMLRELGYFTKTPDRVFDEYTKDAVAKFQKKVDLYSYGVCDLTTQSYLVSEYLETDFLKDEQFDFAVEYLKNNKK